ncbi:hypothetical protein cypCar_00037456 [Cyprinus carpio]|nr:hypothetical protein cypCar_00037456 [Cyprinus carpio]
MEACLGEELPAPTELEEALRNGVYLAKLGHCFAPRVVPLKKIYDLDQQRYKASGLQFRHTDNINHWRSAMTEVGLPTIFHPETTDVYDKKNMPRAVYCIHALSLFLFRLGLAPQIHDLCGKVKFTEEEINNMKLELDKYGIQMPAFSKIGGILANELSVDEAAVHAAVIAINEAVDRGCVEVTGQALRNPSAMLTGLLDTLVPVYQEMLRQARLQKAARARTHGNGSAEKDIYEEYLTQREIQDSVNRVNMRAAVERVDEALDCADSLALLSALQNSSLALTGLIRDHAGWYLEQLTADREQKALDLGCVDPLEREELQEGVSVANEEAQRDRTLQQAVCKINEAVRRGEARQTVRALMNPDAHLPDVYPFAAELYQRELAPLQRQCPQILFITMKRTGMLRLYFEELCELKRRAGKALLSWNDLQTGLNSVNTAAHQEHEQILTIGLINQALSRSDPQKTLSALMLPSSGLQDVLPLNAGRYHDVLTRAKRHKAELSRDPGAELWLADIQDAVRLANQDTQKALKMCLGLAAVNQAVKEGRASQTLRVLRLPEVALRSVVSGCADGYQTELTALLRAKTLEGDNRSPWMRTKLPDSSSYFFHLQKLEGTWERPQGFVQNSSFLTHEEIQSHWRRLVQQREYRRRLQHLYQNWRAVVKIQATVKMWLTRRRYLARLAYFRRHVGAIIQIQAFFRASRTREEYHLLVHSSAPPLSVVRKFAHLLEFGDSDIRQEGELQRLREDVTQPLYLAQLIFLMPQNKSTRFMETVIFTLFNYGSDCREAFLLLQLFTAALRHEIQVKVDRPQEVVTGSPTVIKMLVSFYRHARGQNALKDVLGPSIRDMLQDRSLNIRTDPLEIYKSWINQTESQTGQKRCVSHTNTHS